MSAAKVFAVCGISYGDEGKGTMVDYLVKKHHANVVVKYNGGCQAAHHVVNEDGTWHPFSQLGSGSFTEGCRTFVSRHVIVSPVRLLREEQHLRGLGMLAMRMLWIDRQCVVASPMDQMVRKVEELARGSARHGSTGLGVGVAAAERWEERERMSTEPTNSTSRCVMIGDGLELDLLRRKVDDHYKRRIAQAEGIIEAYTQKENTDEDTATAMKELLSKASAEKERFYSQCRNFASAYRDVLVDGVECLRRCLTRGDTIVMEGAQGALIDYEHGFFPHVTKSKCRFDNAVALLEEAGEPYTLTRVAAMRAYCTRHGPGPFVSEIEQTPDVHDVLQRLAEFSIHNAAAEWQGSVRLGWLDIVAMRYGLRIAGGADAIALTVMDRLVGLAIPARIVRSYEYRGRLSQSDLLSFADVTVQESGAVHLSELKLVEEDGAPGLGSHAHRLGAVLNDCVPGDVLHVPMGSLCPPPAGDALVGASPAVITREVQDYIEAVEALMDLPVSIVSFGPTAADKIDLPAATL